jgi:hypothetical protein
MWIYILILYPYFYKNNLHYVFSMHRSGYFRKNLISFEFYISLRSIFKSSEASSISFLHSSKSHKKDNRYQRIIDSYLIIAKDQQCKWHCIFYYIFAHIDHVRACPRVIHVVIVELSARARARVREEEAYNSIILSS